MRGKRETRGEREAEKVGGEVERVEHGERGQQAGGDGLRERVAGDVEHEERAREGAGELSQQRGGGGGTARAGRAMWPAGPERLWFCGVWARPRCRASGVAASGGCEVCEWQTGSGVCLGLWAWADGGLRELSCERASEFLGKGGGLAKAVESAIWKTENYGENVPRLRSCLFFLNFFNHPHIYVES